ncbi:hypothetical protein CMUS01_07828 [Colletotrichum musicola]|uniref:Uncharacterized protein n=1 Tax=Colletotrichum musicola TaxID=2175873 RepID=A0A8H6KEP8_9PEZI|nr:hypothetical protein CMUS01_07828 [Colletotrichum musicola]
MEHQQNQATRTRRDLVDSPQAAPPVEEFSEEGKSAEQIECMQFMQVCQDEMRKFAVNIQNLERTHHDQAPVLAEIKLYDDILIETGLFFRCATEPVISFNTSFDKLVSGQQGKSYSPISFVKPNADVGNETEYLISELRLRRDSISQGLRLSSLGGVIHAVLDENVSEPSLAGSTDEKIDAERSDWPDWDSQSDVSAWSDDSIFTGAESASTQSSLPHMGVYALREKLTSLITDDADIIRIYVAGLEDKSVGSEDITRALRSRLRKLGKQLGQLSSPEQQACAKVILRGARYVAEAVRRKHDPEYREMLPYMNKTSMTDEEKNRYIMRMIEESRGSATEQPTDARELDLNSDSSGDDDEDESDTGAILLRRMKEVEESIWSHPSMTIFPGSQACPACECWPPQDLIGTEYTCAAGTSPGTSPAVGPNYLLHYFEHPEHLRPGQKLLIRYVPLKMGARLAAGEDEMKAGWGLYFEEGWHLKTICVVLSVLMVVTSMVFGIT